MLCDRVQEFKSSVAAVVEGSLYHHHRVIGFMVIGFMVFTQRFRDSFLGDARLRFRGILRFILHLLRVKPLTSYKSSCSSSSHTINYSESCHSLQRVMPLTTASQVVHLQPVIPSSTSSRITHLQHVSPFTRSKSFIIYKILHSLCWKGSWTRSSARNRSCIAFPPHFLDTKQVSSFRFNFRSSFLFSQYSSRLELSGTKYQAMNYSYDCHDSSDELDRPCMSCSFPDAPLRFLVASSLSLAFVPSLAIRSFFGTCFAFGPSVYVLFFP